MFKHTTKFAAVPFAAVLFTAVPFTGAQLKRELVA